MSDPVSYDKRPCGSDWLEAYAAKLDEVCPPDKQGQTISPVEAYALAKAAVSEAYRIANGDV